MKPIRKTLRFISAFLIVNMLHYTFYPTIAYALTAGPTSPETNSFEPFDTTDLVNLSTGDFVYNIPVLEVPGPAGGYPISLAYHAGILPNEEASWVGLGWTLNPGSINRSVNGYPDDYNEAGSATRQFWEGGERTTSSYGLNVGIAGLFSFDAGVSVSKDTYEGVGVGSILGVSANLPYTSLGVSFQSFGDPYSGGTYNSVGLRANIGVGQNIAAQVGINLTSGGSLSGSVGIGSFNATSLGATISSQGVQSQFSFRGISGSSNISNKTAGKISLSTTSSDLTIPIWKGVFFTFGKSYTRYWIDELDNALVNGSLNLHSTLPSKKYLKEHDFDIYTHLEVGSSESLDISPEPDATLGGTFPDYDDYIVQGQGLAGQIRPYVYQAHLNKRHNFIINNENDTVYKVTQVPIGVNNTKTHFRFVNDLSNDQLNSLSNWQIGGDNTLSYQFNQLPDKEGYVDNQLAGSKHVEYLTNQQINNLGNLFLETRSKGFSRNDNDKIGAFQITNESGITYHYALPAYAYDEFQFSKNKDEANGLYYNQYEKREPYAYTWHLTAVTGPDFLDRGGANGSPNGQLDKNDWGYWVEFDYGKWTDMFSWRNPAIGFSTDIDQDFESFTQGKKELYYLDAIRTKSHTAYFVKDIRLDSRSTTNIVQRRILNTRQTENGQVIENGSVVDVEEIDMEGSFRPQQVDRVCAEKTADGLYSVRRVYNGFVTSTLKLDRIILVDNDQVAEIDRSNGIEYENSYSVSTPVFAEPENQTVPLQFCDVEDLTDYNHHLYQNILDVYDFALVGSEVISKSSKSIEFTTDYSLMPGTPNSYDCSRLVNESCFDRTFGKLTLKELQVKGIGGMTFIPPTKFEYGKDIDLPENSFGSEVVQVRGDGSNEFMKEIELGDFFSFIQNGKVHYEYVTAIHSDFFNTVPFAELTDFAHPVSNNQIELKISKNPPFNQEAIDQWGFFKSDYNFDTPIENETIGKRTSELSAKSVDVWSLSKIKTNLGSEIVIDYESDEYENVALAKNSAFRIKSIEPQGDGKTLEIGFFGEGVALGEIFDPNDEIELVVATIYDLYNSEGGGYGTPNTLRLNCDCGPNPSTSIQDSYDEYFGYYHTSNTSKSRVITINGSPYTVIVEDEELYEFLDRTTFSVDWTSNYSSCPEFSCNYKADNGHLFITGGYAKTALKRTYGGGLRTKSIAVNSERISNVSKYTYESGVTSFEPFGLLRTRFLEDFLEATENGGLSHQLNNANRTLKKEVLDSYSDIFVNAREIVPPGIIYQSVTTTEEVDNYDGLGSLALPGKSVYEFQAYEKGLIDLLPNEVSEGGEGDAFGTGYSKVKSVVTRLKNYSSRVGTLKKVEHYDQRDSQESPEFYKSDESIYHYLHDDYSATDLVVNDPDQDDQFEVNSSLYENAVEERFNNLGVVKEVYTNVRIAQLPNDSQHMYGVLSTRETFPTIKTGETHINYKTGIETKSFIVEYDHFSGVPIKTISSDGYGNYYLNETRPAYKEYSAMGLAVEGGKNMLAQNTGQQNWRIAEPSNFDNVQNESFIKLGLVGASVQTWSNDISILDEGLQANVWRKKSTFSWVGDQTVDLTNDGLYQESDFADFNYSDASSNTGWERNGEITLYDIYSHALEALDINDNYASIKMDIDNEKVFASISNASYHEFAFSGSEDLPIDDMFGGGVAIAQGVRSTTEKHTGNYSLYIPSGASGFSCELFPKQSRYYRVSFWVHESGVSNFDLNQVNWVGNSGDATNHDISSKKTQSGEWYLVDKIIDIENSDRVELEINATGGNIYVDDFRVHPVDASMVSYVYNDFGQLSYLLDADNLFTYYEYNVDGKLAKVEKETFRSGVVKIQDVIYNYKNATNN